MKSPFDGNIDKTSGDFQLRISLENCFAYGGDGVMRVLVIPDIHLKTWIAFHLPRHYSPKVVRMQRLRGFAGMV